MVHERITMDKGDARDQHARGERLRCGALGHDDDVRLALQFVLGSKRDIPKCSPELDFFHIELIGHVSAREQFFEYANDLIRVLGVQSRVPAWEAVLQRVNRKTAHALKRSETALKPPKSTHSQ